MKIAFGNDHAAFAERAALLEWLGAQRHEVIDMGSDSPDSVDYPDFAGRVARSVASGEADLGVLICGSGIGMSIAANKVRGARAALCVDEFSGEMSRRHNNANVCCLRSREQKPEMNLAILGKFLGTDFEGDRHARRVDKISALEG